MFPITFIILLVVVSVPGQIAATDGIDSLLSGPRPWIYLLSLILSQFAIAFVVVLKTRKIVRLMHDSSTTQDIAARADRLFDIGRWSSIAFTATHLFSPLSRWVLGWFDSSLILRYLPLAEFVFIAPAIFTWFILWTCSYFVEDAARQRALPFRLQQKLPVHEMPALGFFLALQARHNFFPVVLLLVGSIINVMSESAKRWYPNADDPRAVAAQVAAGVISIGFFLFILPMVLVRIWSAIPLTGPLRLRLDGVAGRYHLRFRNILLWRTHNLVINAAILGWLPFSRYFLLSDSLLEAFDDRQLESVFAHEVGHGIHHHLHWLIAVGASILFLGPNLAHIFILLHPFANHQDTIELILAGILLFALAALTIPIIAPRFEHQADWFACRHMALIAREEPPINGANSALPLSGSTPAETITIQQYAAGQYPHASIAPAAPPATTAQSPALKATAVTPEVLGAEVFISALDSLVEASHRDRNRRGIFHPSVANRIALLRKLAIDPAAEQAFNTSMRRTRRGIIALAFLTIVAATSFLLPSKAATQTQPTASTKPATNPAPQSAPITLPTAP